MNTDLSLLAAALADGTKFTGPGVRRPFAVFAQTAAARGLPVLTPDGESASAQTGTERAVESDNKDLLKQYISGSFEAIFSHHDAAQTAALTAAATSAGTTQARPVVADSEVPMPIPGAPHRQGEGTWMQQAGSHQRQLDGLSLPRSGSKLPPATSLPHTIHSRFAGAADSSGRSDVQSAPAAASAATRLHAAAPGSAGATYPMRPASATAPLRPQTAEKLPGAIRLPDSASVTSGYPAHSADVARHAIGPATDHGEPAELLQRSDARSQPPITEDHRARHPHGGDFDRRSDLSGQVRELGSSVSPRSMLGSQPPVSTPPTPGTALSGNTPPTLGAALPVITQPTLDDGAVLSTLPAPGTGSPVSTHPAPGAGLPASSGAERTDSVVSRVDEPRAMQTPESRQSVPVEAAASDQSLRADHNASRAASSLETHSVAAHAGSAGESGLRPISASQNAAFSTGNTDVAKFSGNVSAQLGDQLVTMTTSGQHSARLQLNPAELGALEIKIAMHDDGAVVTISTQHSHTRDVIDAGLPRLRELFAAEGLNLVDVDVSANDGRSKQHDKPDSREHFASERANSSAADPVVAVAETSVAPVDSVQARLLDIYA